ncbi:nitrogen regulatory protein PII [Bacillus capparidis]|uniref:Nitrogen regulatory protein PII n=1 Tax=Bacillus capparidis TaxID=1840411 RepID=A0ABS4CYF0_9BACI|nr:nitrogen regulatory protein PII [Bacillus capparidis]
MKKIEVIIRPEKLTETIKGLKNIGITGFTVSQVVGRGKQKDTQGVYRETGDCPFGSYGQAND